MKLKALLKGGKKVLGALGVGSFGASLAAVNFDGAVAFISAITGLVATVSAVGLHWLEAVSKVKGWIPMDADIDGNKDN